MSAIGWLLTRSSTTPVTVSPTLANGAAAAFPATFFSATAYSSGATVTTLATGVITIVTTGWYQLSCTTSALVNVSGMSLTAMLTTPQWAYSINGGEASGPIYPGERATVHLNAGDTVQPMIHCAGDPVTKISPDSQTASNVASGAPLSVTSVQGFAHFTGRLVDV